MVFPSQGGGEERQGGTLIGCGRGVLEEDSLRRDAEDAEKR